MEIMEKILEDVKAQGVKDFKNGIDRAKLSDKEAKATKKELVDTLMLQYDITKDVAEKQVNAQFEANKEASEKAQWQKLYSQIQVDKLSELKGVLASNLSSLGGALRDDFKQISGGLSLIAEAPGVKSILAILSFISATLGSLLLASIKSNLSFDNWFGKRISMKEGGGVDFAKTLKNFNPFTSFTADDETEGGGVKKTPFDGTILDRISNGFDSMYEGSLSVIKSLGAGFGKGLRFYGESVNGFFSAIGDAGTKLMETGKAAKEAFMNPVQTMKNMGKSLWGGIKNLASGVKNFVFAMGAGIKSFLLMTGAILIKVGIIALVAGFFVLMGYLLFKGVMLLVEKIKEFGTYLSENWGRIKEGFNIMFGTLGLWKDKAVTFIGNTFEKIWLSIRGFFITVMEGIERGINYAIDGINEMIPGERYDLKPVDLGAGDMRAELEKDKGAFEIKQKSQGEEFERRQQDLLDRKSANTMDNQMAKIVQQNNVVNEGDKSTQIMATGTNPVDVQAGNLALAQ
jgi:hypothetical protein